MTIVGVLIAAAILMLVGIAVAQLGVNSTKSKLAIERTGRVNDVRQYIRGRFDCDRSMSGHADSCKAGRYIEGLDSGGGVVFADFPRVTAFGSRKKIEVRGLCSDHGHAYAIDMEYRHRSGSKLGTWKHLYDGVPLACQKDCREEVIFNTPQSMSYWQFRGPGPGGSGACPVTLTGAGVRISGCGGNRGITARRENVGCLSRPAKRVKVEMVASNSNWQDGSPFIGIGIGNSVQKAQAGGPTSWCTGNRFGLCYHGTGYGPLGSAGPSATMGKYRYVAELVGNVLSFEAYIGSTLRTRLRAAAPASVNPARRVEFYCQEASCTIESVKLEVEH